MRRGSRALPLGVVAVLVIVLLCLGSCNTLEAVQGLPTDWWLWTERLVWAVLADLVSLAGLF